jgi:Ca2+-binding RTX toxin-like protein
MAQIDASGLYFDFNAFLDASVVSQQFAGSSSGYYTWNTGTVAPFYRITAFSFVGNITAIPTSGTIDRISITNDNYTPGFSITDLNMSLTDAPFSAGLFWRRTLAGDTTILMPDNPNVDFRIMGDYLGVLEGETATGGNDTFIGNGVDGAGAAVGDAVSVGVGGILNGGDDLFVNVGAVDVFGDQGGLDDASGWMRGTLNGGDDTITLNDEGYSPSVTAERVIGDGGVISPTGMAIGGVDRITLRDILAVGTLTGDNESNLGVSIGGADVIIVETTLPGLGFASAGFVSGDDYSVGGTLTGGADVITLSNAAVSVLSGDAYVVAGGTVTGGDDVITFRGTFPGVQPAYPVLPTAIVIAGDVAEFAYGNSLEGGDDTISVTDALATSVSGDAFRYGGLGTQTGGNDVLTIVLGRTASILNASAYGEGLLMTSASFTGGNDTIVLDIHKTGLAGNANLVGDVETHTINTVVTIQNGSDYLRASALAGQSATLYGDSLTINGLAELTTVHDGDDTLIGGSGGDSLIGDTYLVAEGWTYTGGDDVLDGRGGNDFIDGGAGIDTVVFALAQSVYVDLNGIAGTESLPEYYFEAQGQGNDHLVGIENVTGSSKGDTIIGNAQANIINGMGGADRMAGGAGNDTYHVDTAGDVTTEGSGQGTDLVLTTVSRTLSVNIENLTLLGSAAIDGNGNTLANIITGNAGNNILRGDAGADTLNGGAGNDILLGGSASDSLNPGSDTVQDVIRFAAVTESTGSLRDIVTGLDLNGEDRLDFTVVPTSIGVQVNTGALNLATINTDIAAAVNAGLAANGAILFDPSSGNLNVAGHRFLVVDANGDGSYTANADYLVQLVNFTGALSLDDFI